MNTFNIHKAGSGLTISMFGNRGETFKRAKEYSRGATVYPTIAGAGMGRTGIGDENITKLAALKARMQ